MGTNKKKRKNRVVPCQENEKKTGLALSEKMGENEEIRRCILGCMISYMPSSAHAEVVHFFSKINQAKYKYSQKNTKVKGTVQRDGSGRN